jgi:DNA-damage-inducible protein D
MENHKIALFEGKTIRKLLLNDEWWFSVIDVIAVLTNSDHPRKYWGDLKKKLIDEGYIEVSEKIGQLKMIAPDGKKRNTDCFSTEDLLRLIQSLFFLKII